MQPILRQQVQPLHFSFDVVFVIGADFQSHDSPFDRFGSRYPHACAAHLGEQISQRGVVRQVDSEGIQRRASGSGDP